MLCVFSGHGIELWCDGNQYIIRCDSGEMASKTLEFAVSPEDAIKAQENEQFAYQVLIKYQEEQLQ